MPKKNHTPGPWSYEWVANSYRVMTKSGHLICSISPLYAYKKSHEENARLISAAPDMLAALKAVEDDVLDNGGYKEDYEPLVILRAAIEKAESYNKITNKI